MTLLSSKLLLRSAMAIAVCGSVAGFTARPAEARVFIGFGFPVFAPYYYPPPVYYPPPAYYPPPPVVYTPPPAYSQAPAGNGQMCYAGQYTCPMDRPISAGSSCYCLGNGGQRVYGRSN